LVHIKKFKRFSDGFHKLLETHENDNNNDIRSNFVCGQLHCLILKKKAEFNNHKKFMKWKGELSDIYWKNQMYLLRHCGKY